MKKIIITIITIILIIVLAVYTGKKLSENDTSNTGTTPVTSNTSVATSDSNIQTPEVTETSTPEVTASPTENPTSTPEPTLEPTPDVSKYSSEEKKQYAINLAEKEWKKSNNDTSVKYYYETVLSDGTYMIAVRSGGATKGFCYVNINTGTCNVELD